MPDTIEHDGETVPLPKEVIEQPTSKTSVYRAGELVHDGATGAPPPGVAGAAGPGGSLNELLQWGIAHSDPAELQRRAAAGEVSAPGQIDREIMDMILGQPIVASMRSCLAKLEAAALAADGGHDAALGALEELEYYAEDLDNANDLAKIGGVQALLGCLNAAPPQPRLQEGACAVLAAGLQNNPKFQEAALALGVPAALLAPLRPDAADGVDAAVRQKALYALSALARSSAASAAAVLALPGAAGCVVAQCADAADAKLRRRACFLLMSLLHDHAHGSPPGGGLAPAALAAEPAAAPALLAAATSDDVDARESALQALVAAAPALAEQLRAAGAAAKLRAAEARWREAAAAEGEDAPADASRWVGALLAVLG